MPRMMVGLVNHFHHKSNANANDEVVSADLDEALRCINNADEVLAEADAELAQVEADLVEA